MNHLEAKGKKDFLSVCLWDEVFRSTTVFGASYKELPVKMLLEMLAVHLCT